MVSLSGSDLAAAQDPAVSNYTWAVWVLQDLGAPVTDNNVNNLVSWMASENSPSTWTGTAGANNPLNNGLGSGGGSGLGSYPDLGTAATYAAKGLSGGITGGNYIGDALKADAPFALFHAATLKATWSGDHYAGTTWAGVSKPLSVPSVSATASAKNGASKGVAVGSNSGVAGVVGGAVDTTAKAASAVLAWPEELGKLLGDLTSPSWWLRVGMGALGLFLFTTGLVGFISTTKPGERATQDVGTAVKAAGKDAAVAAVAA